MGLLTRIYLMLTRYECAVHFVQHPGPSHHLDSRMGLCPDLDEEGAQSAGLLHQGIDRKACKDQMSAKQLKNIS